MITVRLKRAVILGVLALVIGYPAYQIFTVLNKEEHREDAVQMLYQVALFQMELLRGSLSDSKSAAATSDLDALKQALYSADYVHQRFSLAVGADRLEKLSFPEQMLQYILRIQIGGERKLDEQEAERFKEAANIYEEVFDTYRGLMSARHEIYRSQNSRLQELDQALTDIFKEAD